MTRIGQSVRINTGQIVRVVALLLLVVTSAPAQKLAARNEAFLEDLSRRSFRFFWEQSDPETGLTLDRARTDGSPHDEQHRDVASTAATGFGLTGLCVDD